MDDSFISLNLDSENHGDKYGGARPKDNYENTQLEPHPIQQEVFEEQDSGFHCSAEGIEFEHDGFKDYEKITYIHRLSLESHYYPPRVLRMQPEITPGIRALLVEWLTRVSHQYHIFPEALFLAVNITDRFLQTTPISQDCAELLGAAALLIASKQEEPLSNHLIVTQILQMSTEPYSRRQVLQMERLILRRLKFDLLAPTSLYFMETLANQTASIYLPSIKKLISRRRSLSRYLLELSLQDYELSQFSPSLLAGCALSATELALKDGYILFTSHTLARKREGVFKTCLKELKLLADSALEIESESYGDDSVYENI